MKTNIYFFGMQPFTQKIRLVLGKCKEIINRGESYLGKNILEYYAREIEMILMHKHTR